MESGGKDWGFALTRLRTRARTNSSSHNGVLASQHCGGPLLDPHVLVQHSDRMNTHHQSPTSKNGMMLLPVPNKYALFYAAEMDYAEDCDRYYMPLAAPSAVPDDIWFHQDNTTGRWFLRVPKDWTRDDMSDGIKNGVWLVKVRSQYGVEVRAMQKSASTWLVGDEVEGEVIP